MEGMDLINVVGNYGLPAILLVLILLWGKKFLTGLLERFDGILDKLDNISNDMAVLLDRVNRGGK